MSSVDYQAAKKELDKRYELRETLGTGAFSEVKKAINRETGANPVAIKIIDRAKCSGKENMIQSEIAILQKVHHPNIIQLYELFETENKIYLVMELVTGGELFDSIVARGHYTEADAAKIVEKILMAVDYLHSMGIAHRDLKPENLLFYSAEPDAKIMISDFGLSKIFDYEEVMKTACGTPGYVAPEVLKRQGYGKEVDIWSLGVITYILLCGYPPFYHENNQELFQQIMRGEYEFDSPHWDDISMEAKDLIRKMLVVDPRKRIDTKQCLEHKFIRKHVPLTKEAAAQDVLVHAQAAYPPIDASTPIENQAVETISKDSKNLAHRVSENLRSRGMSVARRKSVDVKPRVSPYIPTHAPPPIPPPRSSTQKKQRSKDNEDRIQSQRDEAGNCGVPLAAKGKRDSGVLLDQSQSVHSSNEKVAKNPNDLFLRQLSRVNRFIEEGNINVAYLALNQIEDVPPKLRVLYEEMIFNLPRKDQPETVCAENVPALAENDSQELNEEKVIEELKKLIMKNKAPSSALHRDQSSYVLRTEVFNPPLSAPANSFETRVVNSPTGSVAEEAYNTGFLSAILGSLIKKTHQPVSQVASDTIGNRADEPYVSPFVTLPDQIKVLTLSLDIKPPGIKNSRSDYKDARVDWFCEYVLPKYDIICLQECFAFGSKRRERILKKADELGFKSWICSPATPLYTDGTHEGSAHLAIDGGLVILSKYCIVRSARMTFEKGVYADKLLAKGALYAKILIPGNIGYQLIHIFNTNLQSSYDPVLFAQYEVSEPTISTRRRQIRALRSFIDAQLQKELRCYEPTKNGVNLHDCVLLMGNFNVNGIKDLNKKSNGDEYLIMKKMLELGDISKPQGLTPREYRLKDMVFDHLGEHPVTFGNVVDISAAEQEPMEKILTSQRLNSVYASLDYIFQIEVKPLPSGDKWSVPSKRIEPKPGSAKVETFKVSEYTLSEEALENMEKGMMTTKISSESSSINAPPVSATISTKSRSNESVPESKQVVFSNPDLYMIQAEVQSTHGNMSTVYDIETTLKTYKSELEQSSGILKEDKNKNGQLGSGSSLESDISMESGTSSKEKKLGMKEILDAKIGAMAAFFSNATSTGDKDKRQKKQKKKLKFTQLSDHYGLSVILNAVERDF